MCIYTHALNIVEGKLPLNNNGYGIYFILICCKISNLPCKIQIYCVFFKLSHYINKINMGIKPGPKRIAISTGKPDRRQRDNKKTPGNTPSLKPHIHKKGD